MTDAWLRILLLMAAFLMGAFLGNGTIPVWLWYALFPVGIAMFTLNVNGMEGRHVLVADLRRIGRRLVRR